MSLPEQEPKTALFRANASRDLGGKLVENADTVDPQAARIKIPG
jgi:hypothetical protein